MLHLHRESCSTIVPNQARAKRGTRNCTFWMCSWAWNPLDVTKHISTIQQEQERSKLNTPIPIKEAPLFLDVSLAPSIDVVK
jgi:hypothetical protein